MSVTNELRHLALYLDELIDTGNGLEVGSSLYEQVQYNNSIIPRLYLMITVTGMNEHFCSCLTLIGKSWKTHPEILLKFSFSGSSHRPFYLKTHPLKIMSTYSVFF